MNCGGIDSSWYCEVAEEDGMNWLGRGRVLLLEERIYLTAGTWTDRIVS